MSPRRVALVIGQLHRGGAENQLFELARGLAADRRNRPSVYCLSDIDRPYGPRLRELGIPVRLFSRRGPAGLLRPLLLRRCFARDRIDLVHSILLGPTVQVALSRGPSGPPHLASYHSSYQLRPAWRRRLESWALRRATHVTACARSARDFVVPYYRLPDERVSVVFNGVAPAPAPARDEARRRLGLSEAAPVMLGVFRLSEEKNLDLFCDVAEAALAPHPDGCCLIAGDGPLREHVGERAARARPGLLRVLGPRDDVPVLLAAADLLLLTSRFEGMPMVVMEAAAAGLPVVSTAVGDVPELIHEGVHGHLRPVDDLAGLAGACSRLLADPVAAREMGRAAGRHMRSSFSVERMVERYVRLYERLTEP